MTKKSKMKSVILWFIAPGLAILALDQFSKKMTAMNFKPNQVAAIWEQKWIFWTRLPNSGLMFQNFEMLYSPENAIWTRFIPALALLVTANFWLRSELKSPLAFSSRLSTLGFSLFWFGGASNILSHCLSTFVDDTISAKLYPGSPFFTFNVADLAISTGLFLFALAVIKTALISLNEQLRQPLATAETLQKL